MKWLEFYAEPGTYNMDFSVEIDGEFDRSLFHSVDLLSDYARNNEIASLYTFLDENSDGGDSHTFTISQAGTYWLKFYNYSSPEDLTIDLTVTQL